MVSNCANPGCGKPLHYLREGRIYVFDASVGTAITGQKRERRLEHYWLCGACAASLILVPDAHGWIRLVTRPATLPDIGDDLAPTGHSQLAS